MADERQQSPLRKVGVMWKPKPNGKSLGSGSMTINGMKQRFVLLRNSRKVRDTDPDFVLMSADEPEIDNYARGDRRPAVAASARQSPDDWRG